MECLLVRGVVFIDIHAYIAHAESDADGLLLHAREKYEGVRPSRVHTHIRPVSTL